MNRYEKRLTKTRVTDKVRENQNRLSIDHILKNASVYARQFNRTRPNYA